MSSKSTLIDQEIQALKEEIIKKEKEKSRALEIEKAFANQLGNFPHRTYSVIHDYLFETPSVYDVTFKSIKQDDIRVLISASSEGASWVNPGKIFAKIYDDGNGISVDVRTGDKVIPFKMDYFEAEVMRVALNAAEEAHAMKRNKKQAILKKGPLK